MKPSPSTISFWLMLLVVLITLSLSWADRLKAQNPQRSFLTLLNPYVGKDVNVLGRSGDSYHRATLLEVGADYIVVDDPGNIKQAIPLHSINSVVLQEKPNILFAH